MKHQFGTPFHMIAWKLCIEETFRFDAQYLLAERGGELQGVLPLFLVQSLFFKKALISSPFAVYGGILAADVETLDSLQRYAQDLGLDLGVEYLESRNGYSEQTVADPNVDRYVTFTKPVFPNEDELFASLPKKTRNVVRKSLKSPFQTRISKSETKRFERLHSQTMRRLGTPAFPKAHFSNILKHFSGSVDVREVTLGDQVVASSLNFLFRDTMHTYYASADPAFNALAPNTYMYFDHLLWCGRNGLREFEFGRSKKGTGPFEFKTHWGTQMRELPYNIVLLNRRTLPNYTPTNGKFSLAVELWKKLPLPLTRSLGPQLIRMFP